ncbi:NAD(P)/FAD-dependent oxidoreductase [Candidatus Uabimicrobium sp. HlEnr_7]|uniref:NAD(P)/FAD-dependent oxidoreductase n=1 Tax=Candidatus Uabimicrobium helgolandensis TaxID=3095367 RepID=UPI0035576D02
MQKLAIIGSGISGIASAYYLRNNYNITIFEKENYLGGHTNTVTIKENGKEYNIDTGFIVYNEVTYPNLTKLFSELEVETQASNMSFSLHNLKTNLQFCGAGLPGIFAQKSNAFRFEYWRFILQIMRFFKTSVSDLQNNNVNMPLGTYLKKRRYNKYFIENYIVPMSSAIWSTSMEKMMEFPARTLIEFFRNHGLLGVDTHHPWRTVANGSSSYIKQICKNISAQIHSNSPVKSVCRDHNGVVVCTKEHKYKFDKVLLATHADQALHLLKDASQEEKNVLGCFKYQKNKAILHCDSSTMPPIRSIWSAWNYKILPGNSTHTTTTTYYMNYLQNLKTTRDYFVSINEFMPIDPQKILYETVYEHPLFSMEAINAQKKLQELQNNGQVFFAGSYFGYGFHEDGLRSAVEVSELLARKS